MMHLALVLAREAGRLALALLPIPALLGPTYVGPRCCDLCGRATEHVDRWQADAYKRAAADLSRRDRPVLPCWCGGRLELPTDLTREAPTAATARAPRNTERQRS